MLILRLIIIFFTLIGIVSCLQTGTESAGKFVSNDSNNNLSPTTVPTSGNGSGQTPGPTPTQGGTTVTYAQLKTQILNSKCINCHNELSNEASAKQYYVVAGYPSQSKLYTVVANNSMPKGSAALSNAMKKLIYDYINSTAP